MEIIQPNFRLNHLGLVFLTLLTVTNIAWITIWLRSRRRNNLRASADDYRFLDDGNAPPSQKSPPNPFDSQSNTLAVSSEKLCSAVERKISISSSRATMTSDRHSQALTNETSTYTDTYSYRLDPFHPSAPSPSSPPSIVDPETEIEPRLPMIRLSTDTIPDKTKRARPEYFKDADIYEQ